MTPNEVTGAKFRAFRTAPGFVRCEHPDGVELTAHDAHEALEGIAALADGGPTPLLVDVRGARSVSRDARKAFTESRVPSRIALYVDSSLSRTMANFFIGVARPDAPTRVFVDLDEAVGWLLDDG